MRTIILIVIIFLAFVPFYCTFDDTETNNPVTLNSNTDSLDLPCCNNNDPFNPEGICPDDDAQVSLACNDNGIKKEKIIKCSC